MGSRRSTVAGVYVLKNAEQHVALPPSKHQDVYIFLLLSFLCVIL